MNRQKILYCVMALPVMLQTTPETEIMMMRVVIDVRVIADWPRADNFTSKQLIAVRKPVLPNIKHHQLISSYARIKFKIIATHTPLKFLIPVILPYLASLLHRRIPCRSLRFTSTNLLSVTRCNLSFGTRGFRRLQLLLPYAIVSQLISVLV